MYFSTSDCDCDHALQMIQTGAGCKSFCSSSRTLKCPCFTPKDSFSSTITSTNLPRKLMYIQCFTPLHCLLRLSRYVSNCSNLETMSRSSLLDTTVKVDNFRAAGTRSERTSEIDSCCTGGAAEIFWSTIEFHRRPPAISAFPFSATRKWLQHGTRRE